MNKKTIITILLAIVMAPLGLEAKKKAKTVEVPQLINYPSAVLSEYRLHGGNVVIQGGFVVPEEAKGEKVPTKISPIRGNVDLLKILFNAVAGKYNPEETR